MDMLLQMTKSLFFQHKVFLKKQQIGKSRIYKNHIISKIPIPNFLKGNLLDFKFLKKNIK